MGRSRYKIYNSDYPHFLTMTTVDWLPILIHQEVAAIVLDSPVVKELRQSRLPKAWLCHLWDTPEHKRPLDRWVGSIIPSQLGAQLSGSTKANVIN